MQRLGNPWPLYTLRARTRRDPSQHGHMRYETWNKWPKITRVPMRNRFPIFEASNLIIDLDAEDSQHVRPFNQDDDGELEHWEAKKKREMQPMMARIAEFEEESNIYKNNFAKVQQETFNPWRISDLDLFSVALLGLPLHSRDSVPEDAPESASGLKPDQITSNVLDWNGIQHRARDSTVKIIPYMLNRQEVSEKRRHLVPLDGYDFCQTLGKCESLTDLERVVSPLLQSPTGQAFVAEQTDSIARECQSLRNVDPSTATAMLSFINNLTINITSQGLPLPATLEEVGLDLSLKCGSFVATQRYINACRHDSSQPFGVDSLTRVLLLALESLDGLQHRLAESSQSGNVFQQPLEVYSLLTGWNFGENLARWSVRSFYHRSHQTRLLYFNCLARLGAFRTMWHEWHSCIDDLSERTTSEPNGGSREGTNEEIGTETREKYNVWTQTLGLSKTDATIIMSRNYAEAILGRSGVHRNIEELLSCVDFTESSDSIQLHHQLDVETIIRQWEMRQTAPASKAPRELYEGGRYEKKIVEIFSYTDVRRTLKGLRNLLAEVQENGHEAS